ncbi:MAG: putative addiction module antidote protein [Candidatus Pseudomonas phytovorans]|uniref:Addiction module antidote protein n=1 Tax=Candidatus Pseudomonas phytovorans TaxID=3121377 RepID=A0AAJ6BCH6_9PSED|nr:addiction module antidote protein [Pseudomonas sp.]WEK30769.1 MAG: putative addiction module antidote protein [Pseudomonas sp.]
MTGNKLTKWDVVDHLKTEQDMLLYLEACLEENDPTLLAAALGDIARARGMAQLARDTGLTREGLYKALSAEGNPSLATIMKVMAALGIRLHAEAVPPQAAG